MITIIDFETTGLDANECVVIEIGAVKLKHNLQPVAEFSRRLKLPDGHTVPEFINKLTGITDEDLVDGEDASVAFSALRNFIGNDIVVAHNATFDLSFLNKYLPHYHPDFVDTRALSKVLDADLSASLADIVRRYRIPYKGHHNAVSDCLMTQQILEKMNSRLNRLYLKTYRDFINVVVETEDRPFLYLPPNAKVIQQNTL